MVQINLLPTASKARRRFALKPIKINLTPIMFSLIGVMLVIILSWALLGMQYTAKQRRLTQLSTQLQKLDSTLQKLDQLTEEKKSFQGKLEFLQEHIKRQILWARNLNQLSNLIPAGIYLKSLMLYNKEIGHLNKYDKLDIDGVAMSVAGVEIIDMISAFMADLKKDKVFAEQFADIKLIFSQRDQSKTIEMMDFKLLCQFR